MKNFALIGAAGFIAVRHMKAIKDTGNNLIAALDKFDSVGIIDSYFPEADFFTEFERFDRHIDKLRHTQNKRIDYVSYLHDSHMRFALKQQAHAICEKPMVLNPWNVDALKDVEKETGKKINNILQLRLHPNIIKLKHEIDQSPNDKRYQIDLTYLTSRGRWYDISWKGDIQKSGGIATNIGVHFFDMLTWIFGDVQENNVHISESDKAAGLLRLKKADVRWFLSIDYDDIPKAVKMDGKRTFRSITVDDIEIEFSDGFTDLHTNSYKEILNGNGFGLDDVKNAVQTVYEIRNAKPIGLKGDYHPFLKK
jgi:UDP-N-acetyl-2-amino-2-deoxyglucuronate dehydrogenase